MQLIGRQERRELLTCRLPTIINVTTSPTRHDLGITIHLARLDTWNPWDYALGGSCPNSWSCHRVPWRCREVAFAAVSFSVKVRWRSRWGTLILGQTPAALDISRDHELIHVCQFERWGLLMGPAYLGCSFVLWLKGRRPYHDNPFEREAYEEGRRGMKCHRLAVRLFLPIGFPTLMSPPRAQRDPATIIDNGIANLQVR